MRRREFIGLIGGAATWPVAVRAQQTAIPVIGLLHSASASTFAEHIPAFYKGLSEAGYVDGQNVTVEYRWAEGRNEILPALAASGANTSVWTIVGSISVALVRARPTRCAGWSTSKG
jgi:putative ABC transport system substrate-binding protein